MTSALLVRLSAMGDLVQSLGAVESLRRARSDVRVTLVTQREWLPLLAGVAGVERVVPFDRRAGLAGVRRLRRELRRCDYDVALDLQGNWKSAFVAWLGRARDCVGMASPWRQEPWSRVLLRRTIACAAAPHPARAAWELIRLLAPDAPFCTAQLVAGADEVAREREHLSRLGVDAGRPFRVVVVTDPADARALPVTTARTWAAAHEQALLLLGPDEAGVAIDGVVVRHARGELRRLVALGALVAAAGGDVVGPDQGATHVLAAAGADTRVLCGSQDPRRTAPAAGRALVRDVELSCRPCMRRTCRHPDGPVCMEFAPPEARAVDVGLPTDDPS